MNHLRVYGLTCVLMLVAALSSATTIVMPTDEQLIAKAPVIVEGNVVSTTPVERDGAVWTDTVISVLRSVKGDVPGTITVSELGGMTAQRFTKIFGAAEYNPGERVMLFLEPRAPGRYRTVDLFVGKLKHAKAANGRRLWTRDDAASDAVLLDADFRPIHARRVERDAAKFEKFIADRLAGRAGTKDYGVENPVLEGVVSDSSVGEGASITSQFTLISEPTVYRWAKFDSGQSANWYSSGSQPGYTSGGVSELQTAMAAWTGYSSATINYSYSGSRTGSMGGLSGSNGVNEVLFNDPLNEISGTFNGSGVVGQGGFNGVSGTSTWTAPFAADSNHPSGSMKSYHISEGNLTIQDGVTPAAGMSSNRLAEILSHEFGHTLGFGHSADNTALMYHSVTGRGPQLRADDQLAARWLYPNGSAPPPTVTAPAAPSGLGSSVSGSKVTLNWNDNSSNESGFRIYLAAGSGSFSRVADAAAGAKTASLSNLAAGSYRSYVVAWNSAGTSAQSNTASFTIASGPVAAFSVSPSSGTAGVTSFTFYDESQGTVSSRSWNFGDGATSTASTASHVYASPGTYTVTLTVGGNGSTSQASKSVTVIAATTKPVAAFHFTPTTGTAGTTTFTFYDDSTGSVSNRKWTFGDGATSTASTASHVFQSAGTYNVTLTVGNSAGSSQVTKQVPVSSSAPVTPQVNAAFDVSASSTSVGSSVSFYDRSSGSPTRWSWSFGDGGTSSARNPSHAFGAPGVYTVKLTASNSASSSTTTRQVTVASLAIAPFRTLVSAAAQTSGAGGTSWRTELTLFNAGTQGASVKVLFLPNAGGNVSTRNLVLSPRQSMTYGNALVDLFGIANGAGALAIEATSAGSTPDLRVTSRTYTSGGIGTFGQAVPDVEPDQLERTLYVTGIESSSAFRTNIGLVNRDGSTVSATLTLYSPSGSVLATKNVGVAPNSFQQNSLGTYFPEVGGGANGTLTMRVSATAADALSAYASVIDNRTQDPIYVQAVPSRGGSSMMLPVVSRANGANGTWWRTDVTLFNPLSTSRTLSLRFGGRTKSISISGYDTVVLADVVTQMGLSSGTGPLQVSWSGSTGPVVTSRTYTTTAGGGTYGQSVDPVAGFAREVFVPGLRNDSGYRTNVGFVNGGGEAETFTVRALSAWGSELGRTTLTVGAQSLVQQAAAALFPNAGLSSFTLVVEGDSNAQLFAYGSMVDNSTGDPVFYAGR